LVILLDDPGFGLHAKAQEDLLQYISEELEPYYQVVYTTHSPFMLDARKLRRARTVEDVVGRSDDGREKYMGTKVGDRSLSTDADTLVPMQAALGYEITQTLFAGENILLVERPSDLLYLRWFSERLAQKGRTALDRAWTIAPCGDIQKMCALMSLLRVGKPNVAMLLDGAVGRKKNGLSPEDSDLLKGCRVFTADMYVDTDGGSIEDLMGRRAYFALVNSCYKLPRKYELHASNEVLSSVPVVKEAVEHFRVLPSGMPVLDRYAPAEHLVESGRKLARKLRDLDEGLDRFERLFVELNSSLFDGPVRVVSPGIREYMQARDSATSPAASGNSSQTETYAVSR
jgi:hypothetical protein